MKVRIELSAEDLRLMVSEHLNAQLGDGNYDVSKIKIEVKSKQNFRSEWEDAEFRAVYLA